MRFVSVILILAGLVIAFAAPIYQTDFAGERIETLRVFDRSLGGWRGGWQDRDVELSSDGGPYRIRLEGRLLPGQAGLPPQLPVFVELNGPQGVVFSGEFAFGVREENPQSGNAEPRLFLSLPEFVVLQSGTHRLSARVLTERDINLSTLDATLVGNAEAANYDFTPAGLALFGIGTVIYLVSSRPRRKAREPGKKPTRWGRQ